MRYLSSAELTTPNCSNWIDENQEFSSLLMIMLRQAYLADVVYSAISLDKELGKFAAAVYARALAQCDRGQEITPVDLGPLQTVQ